MSRTNEILGYGKDALTLWILRHYKSKILDEFKDKQPIRMPCVLPPKFWRKWWREKSGIWRVRYNTCFLRKSISN